MSDPVAEAVASNRRHGDVTVVVATYNGSQYIEQQLESLCSQTLLPSRIVISDDGSSDGTLLLADRCLRGTGLAYEIVANPGPRGFANNFIYGMSRVDTSYVAFCDQDDVWSDTKLAVCVARLEVTGAAMCVHGARLIDSEGRHIGPFLQAPRMSRSFEPNTLAPWFTFYGCTIVARMEVVRLIDAATRGEDFWRSGEPMAHDAWVTLLSSSLDTIEFIDAALTQYRQHNSNLVGAGHQFRSIRLLNMLGPAAHPNLNRSAIARRWAAKMKALSGRPVRARHQAAAVGAAARWTRVAAIELSRLKMYSDTSQSRRAKRFARLVLQGAYRGGSDGLGWRYLPKDFLIGLLRIRRIQD